MLSFSYITAFNKLKIIFIKCQQLSNLSYAILCEKIVFKEKE